MVYLRVLCTHLLHLPFFRWAADFTHHLDARDCVGLVMLSLLIWWGIMQEKHKEFADFVAGFGLVALILLGLGVSALKGCVP